MDVNPVQNSPSPNPVPPPITPPTPVAPLPPSTSSGLGPPPVTPPASPNPLSFSPPPPSSPLNPSINSGLGPPASLPPEKPKSHKKLIALGLLLILAIALPLTVFVSRQQQVIEQEAEEPQLTPETIMFEINGEPFSLQNIIEVAKEQYSETDAGTKEVQKIAKDILIEREILDLTGSELGVSVSSEERAALVEASGLSENEAYYELLREKVALAKVRYIKAFSIGYWVPPPRFITEQTTEDKERSQEQLDAGPSAIDQAESGLKRNQNPLTLARSIVSNSPALSDSLSVNGYKLDSITEDEQDLLSDPEFYEYNDSNFDDATRNALFAQNVSERQVIKIPANDSNGGEVVYKIVEKSDTGAGSYVEWLKSQRDSLVTKEIPL
ncbi:MAG: hypothetical protein UU21_C0014G0013 [Candidatus Levybacteria bacterium GW2011_GWA2_40_8]|nr:MAG: hypothetical protein UU21_C0014G0013 [Candidatus Levybacteria bacterium GW2011_GWA2_40_8]